MRIGSEKTTYNDISWSFVLSSSYDNGYIYLGGFTFGNIVNAMASGAGTF